MGRFITMWAVSILLLTACSAAQPASTGPGGESPPISPAASAIGEPQVIPLVVEDAAFSSDKLEAVSGAPIVIAFDNRDGIRHNFQLWQDDSRTEKLFFGTLIDGPGEIEYELGPLEPGEYLFECHPHSQTMFGYLTVTEASTD